MPQMKPMNWFFLYCCMNIFMIILNIMNYFNYMFNNFNNKKMNIFKKKFYNWKW